MIDDPVIRIAEHPLLEIACIKSVFPNGLAELSSPGFLTKKLSHGSESPMQRDDDVKTAVRQLLRFGGYQPSGRGKPASEYLAKMSENGKLASINPAVDVCNAVSLHSGLPISVIDLDAARGPFTIRIAGASDEYVFNISGQTIKLSGLICLFDEEGPCACGVKDSQRTKTNEKTRTTLSVIWGTNELPGRTTAAADWYQRLLRQLGVQSEWVEPSVVTGDQADS